MAYNYVVTAQRPTVVTHSFTGNFISPNEINILLIKSNYIEIYSLNEDSLTREYEVPVYGRITGALTFRPSNKQQDYLFILTDTFQYAILSFDSMYKRLITEDSGNLEQEGGKTSMDGPHVCIDSSNRFILCHIYKGSVIVLQLDANGHLEENTRPEGVVIYELEILSLCFLDIVKEYSSSHKMNEKLMEESPEKEKETEKEKTKKTFKIPSAMSKLSKGMLKRRSSKSELMGQESSESSTLNTTENLSEMATSPRNNRSKERLVVCVLYEDYNASRHLKTYYLNMETYELSNGPWDTLMVEEGCHTLVNIPKPLGGVLMIGKYSIAYRGEDNCQRVQVQDGMYMAYAACDGLPYQMKSISKDTLSGTSKQESESIWKNENENENLQTIPGSRFLIGDAINRTLNMITLESNARCEVRSLACEVLGSIVAPSCISYLDNGKCFIGSVSGDHQLVMIHPNKYWKSAEERDAQDDQEEEENDVEMKDVDEAKANVSEKDGVIEILEELENIGPITDMCAVDLERQGQCQLVCCSGVGRDGSLRIVKNGIGIEETAAIDMPGIEGLWSLAPDSTSTFHLYLVQSFVSETRVLTVTEEGLEEIEMEGLNRDGKTVYLGNMNDDTFVQVTPQEIRLINIQSPFALIHMWSPETLKQKQINSAVSNRSQILCALSGGNLSLLEINNAQELTLINSVTLKNEISCICLSPTASFNEKSSFAGVGLWKQHVIQLMSLPDFQLFYTLDLQTQTVPRSVLITDFHSPGLVEENKSVPWLYLFVGMGDGSLVEAHVEIKLPTTNKTLSAQLLTEKRLVLGNHPIRLSPFICAGRYYVFAGCDRPSIVYRSKNRLYYSNINLSEMNYLCGFNAEEYSDSLAMAVEQQLMIGTMDEVQKIHIQKVALKEQPRRIAYNPQQRLYLLATHTTTEYPLDYSDNQLSLDNNLFHPNYDQTVTRLHLINDQTFEPVFTKTLKPRWFVSRIIAHTFKSDPHVTYFIVGSAEVWPQDTDARQGKLEMFTISDASRNESSTTIYPDTEKNDVAMSGVTTADLRGPTNVNFEVSLQRVYHQVFQRASPDVIAPLGDNHLVVGVKNKIYVFEWILSPTSEGDTYPFILKHMHTVVGRVRVVDIKTCGDFFIVGDIMQSVQIYVFSAGENVVQEIARDSNPSWLMSLAVYDDQFLVAADAHHNLFALMRNVNSSNNDERSTLQVISRYHIGTQINMLLKGSLVMESIADDDNKESKKEEKTEEVEMELSSNTKEEKEDEQGNAPMKDKSNTHKMMWDLAPLKHNELKRYLFGTIDGSIGALLSIPKSRFMLLTQVEKALNAHIEEVGRFKHSDWRRFRKEGKSSPSVGFVDGDIVQKFLELTPEHQQKIAQEVDIDVNALTFIIEEMNRLH